MSIFNIFKRQRPADSKSSAQSNPAVPSKHAKKNPTTPVVTISTEIISSQADDVIPATERVKSAIPSKHGLYPHEILMLDYADSYYTVENSFQGFWWYRYGVRNVADGLRSLVERGFLQIGDLQSAIEKENATVLKEELKKRGLKTSGKKADLVKRLLEEAPHEELNIRFSKRTYQLTDLGKQALAEESYVSYIHRHQLEDFGLYRNCRYHMYLFLMEEKRIKDALGMLAEVVFYDLSGLGNGYDPQFFYICAEYFFPYKESNATTAPGIISAIMNCQKELGLTDEELRAVLLDRMSKLSAPFHLFTPEECVDIVFMENRQDEEALTKIYAKAKRRFKQKYPNIKC